jgi:hypothetical protein
MFAFMRSISKLYHIILASFLALLATLCATAQSRIPIPGRDRLVFTENRGQIRDSGGVSHPEIAYTASSGNVQLFFSGHAISYVFRVPDGREPSLRNDSPQMRPSSSGTAGEMDGYRVDMELVGSRDGSVLAEEPAAGWDNYYHGDRSGVLGVRSFRRLIYRDLYPGIDMVVYGGERGMKYDFIVRPGGRAADIRLRYVAAGGVSVTRSGGLRVVNPLGTIEEGKPYSYQPEDSRTTEGRGSEPKRNVASRFRLSDGTVGFELGDYDRSRTLVIDPGVKWSTYFGGSDDEFGAAVAVDSAHNVFVGGYTTSNDFPVSPGAFQNGFKGGSVNFNSDGFLLKLDQNGMKLWATYFGGADDDFVNAVAVDRHQGPVIAGATMSADFPTTPNAFQRSLAGPDGGDAFLAKFDSTGKMVWSTYYGGSGADIARGVAIDSSNNIVMGGATSSTNLPVSSGAVQGSNNGSRDFLIVKFNAGGQRLWGTYYGGNANDDLSGVAIDRSGGIFLAGYTGPGNFPITPDALQTNVFGPFDAVVMKLDSNGNVRWATLYGGNNIDQAHGISVSEGGDPVVTGETNSSDFPTTPGVAQEGYAGGYDLFVLKLTAAGKRTWGTLYGGLGDEEGLSVGCDWLTDAVIVTGNTASGNFPIPPGTLQNKLEGITDAFTLRFGNNGRVLWGTLLGGGQIDKSYGVAVDNGAGIVITGYTHSDPFPVTSDAMQPKLSGYFDAFIVRYACSLGTTVVITGDTAACTSVPATLKAPPGYDFYRWSDGSKTQNVSVTRPGIYSVVVADSAGCSAQSPPFNVRPALRVAVAPPDSVYVCPGDSVMLSAPAGFSAYLWSNGDTMPTTFAHQSGLYSVTVIDSVGCNATSRPVLVTLFPVPPPPPISQCGLTLTAPPGIAYQWQTGDSIIPGATSRSFTVDDLGTYSVTVTDTNGCKSRSNPYQVTGETIATSSVTIPRTLQANPGDVVFVPIILESSQSLPAGPKTFSAIFRYDRTLLYPIDTGIVTGVAPGGEHTVEFHGYWSGTGDTIGVAHFVAMLGDSDSTPLVIDKFTWNTDCPVLATFNGGNVQLNICRQGGARLLTVSGDLALKTTRTSPGGPVDIEYDLIESGMTSLYLADLSGRRMATIVSGEMRPGHYRASLDISGLPSGAYFYVLETPTQRLVKGTVVGR